MPENPNKLYRYRVYRESDNGRGTFQYMVVVRALNEKDALAEYLGEIDEEVKIGTRFLMRRSETTAPIVLLQVEHPPRTYSIVEA